MSKQELVNFIAEETGMTKADAARALTATIEGIKKGLKDEGKVSIVGFGTFAAKERAARTGRNPRTNETIEIPASIAVGFKAGSGLKEELNA